MTVSEFLRDRDVMFARLLSGLAMVVAFASTIFVLMHCARLQVLRKHPFRVRELFGNLRPPGGVAFGCDAYKLF